jgi:hypothetical protein
VIAHGGLTAQRGYYNIDGQSYIRLSKVKDAWPKPWLAPWMVKNVAESVVDQLSRSDFLLKMAQNDAEGAVKHVKGLARRTSDKAMQRGTDAHTDVETAILTGDYDGAPAGFRSFVDEYGPEFTDVERTVFDPELKVAGTFDARAIIDGEQWLIDWKTGRAYDEHALQLAFYCGATHVWDAAEGISKDWEGATRAAVVLLDAEPGEQVVEFDIKAAWPVFVALHQVATADVKTLRKAAA